MNSENTFDDNQIISTNIAEMALKINTSNKKKLEKVKENMSALFTIIVRTVHRSHEKRVDEICGVCDCCSDIIEQKYCFHDTVLTIIWRLFLPTIVGLILRIITGNGSGCDATGVRRILLMPIIIPMLALSTKMVPFMVWQCLRFV